MKNIKGEGQKPYFLQAVDFYVKIGQVSIDQSEFAAYFGC